MRTDQQRNKHGEMTRRVGFSLSSYDCIMLIKFDNIGAVDAVQRRQYCDLFVTIYACVYVRLVKRKPMIGMT